MGVESGAAVQEGIRRWVHRFNHADLEGLLSLYSEQAVLVPTTLAEPLTGTPLLRGYFDRVMSRRPRLHARLHEPLVVRVQTDWALCSGCHDFAEEEVPVTWLPARFSFCWRLEGDAWRILDHHSSWAPGAAPPPS
ncbi:nuclear transport factor 2 family protein [Hydrogenophaga sp.]|uniref:nuclear transport factor 2 family protein n=1 Tax=Hydrogenophaga sp. TaxID=1904254 RepID=UPI002C30168C|nr:nuclear transport factor 2 family protein [Hydrogenophaga sp.]HMP11684.1 nuclear transport factor 2 family protein [Hydrogenophaga sp.]